MNEKEITWPSPKHVPTRWESSKHSIERMCDSLEEGIKRKVYGVVAIWYYDKKYHIVHRPNNQSAKTAKARIDWIRLGLDNGSINPGKYVVQTKLSRNTSGDGDLFGFEITENLIKEKEFLPVVKEPEAVEAETMISPEEYLRIIRENESLKAQIALLQTQMELEKKYMLEHKALNDPGPKWAEHGVKALSDIANTGMAMFQQYLMMKQGNVVPNPGMSSGPQDQVSKYASDLLQIKQTQGDDAFWKNLEELEQVNPEVCKAVMQKLNVEWEEDEQK